MNWVARNIPLLTGLLALVACTNPVLREGAGSAWVPEDAPRTSRDFPAQPDDLRFLVVGDRTGGHRPGVFAGAMTRINDLRPELVMSVGDLIEGYQTEPSALAAQWDEVQGYLEQLEMPFFYVPGNHDISNPLMQRWWRESLGRDYYHFLYKGALFIALNTEDPPTAQQRREALAAFPPELLEQAAGLAHLSPEEVAARLEENPELARAAAVLGGDRATISRAQRAWLHGVLAEHPAPRWTFVFMHKPAWRYDNAAFEEIEAALHGRQHTVFAGHFHYYQHSQRQGHDYIQMGATGGVRGLYGQGSGDMDHLLWVTLSGVEPTYSVIELDGLHGIEGAKGEHREAGGESR